MTATEDDCATLVQGLLDPAAYPHAVEAVEHRETHISHVLLAGDYAYKIKKPLDLGFLDFSSAEQRAHYCAEEIRLNGRLAPGIYLDVVAITGTPEAPRVGGDGPVLEHAVRMRRFDDRLRLDRELAAGRLERATIEAVAERIARFHEDQASTEVPASEGTPAAVIAPMRENFAQIRPILAADDADAAMRLDALADWTEERAQALQAVLLERHAAGRVRECHGDMHLGNMVRAGDDIAIFDGIEFSAGLRWIDVASEIAFLVMDLDHAGAHDLAGRALDTWLAATGDYAALDVMRFYSVYRALVRAKIHAIRAGQQAHRDRAQALADTRAYIELAERYAHAHAPALLLTRGVSGTGKSTAAAVMVERIGAIRLRSDVERLRLYPDALPEIRYSEAANDAVHARLESLAASALTAGWPVVADATFIEHHRRAPFLELAQRLAIPARILDLQLPRAERDARIRARAAAGRDPSEADPNVAAAQERHMDALTDTEAEMAVAVSNEGAAPIIPATGLAHGRGFGRDTAGDE